MNNRNFHIGSIIIEAMTILHALVLGFVEGLTEFLPVSSTAHLILTSRILGLSQTEFQTLFEVVIQVGAISAVLFLYKKQLLNIRLLKQLCVSFIPTAVVGLALHKIIKTVFFQSNSLIALSLVSIGICFILIEKFLKQKQSKSLSSLPYKEAFIVGLAQSFAVIPGVSRAGIVLITLIVLGYKRDESAQYSFLLALPTIGAAALLDIVKASHMRVSTFQIELIGIGLIVAFITAYLSMRWFIGYLQKNTLIHFGIYRIGVGIMSLFF